MAAFTPGPWQWSEAFDGLEGKDGEAVFWGVWRPDRTADIDFEKVEDACLITAAPDLYKAAKAMIAWANDPDNDPETQWAILLSIGRQLSLAIAKAEGN